MKWFFYTLKFICYLPLLLLFPVKVIGKKKMPKGKVIVAANHLSAMDIVLQMANLPGFRYSVAKKELANNKFIGGFLTWLGAIYIDREKADVSAMKKILGALKKNEGVSIFPEGTRNKNDEELQPIKEGVAMFAIKGKACIVPVMIYRKVRLFSFNYIMVGDPFELNEFYGARLDANKLKEASDIIESKMQETQKQLNDYVYFKKNKHGKVLVKQSKKAKKSLSAAMGELSK